MQGFRSRERLTLKTFYFVTSLRFWHSYRWSVIWRYKSIIYFAEFRINTFFWSQLRSDQLVFQLSVDRVTFGALALRQSKWDRDWSRVLDLVNVWHWRRFILLLHCVSGNPSPVASLDCFWDFDIYFSSSSAEQFLHRFVKLLALQAI